MHTARRLLWLVFVVLTCSLQAQDASNEQSARLLRLEKFVVPEFPSFLRLGGFSRGTVAIAVGRDAQGLPADLLVLESTDPAFTQAALEAVRQWRFSLTPEAGPVKGFVPLVRFLFSSRGVAVSATAPVTEVLKNATSFRADSPVSLPSLDQLDRRPRALQQPMPTLTAAAGGEPSGAALVTVKYFVDAEGRARVPTVMEAASPEVAAAALAAISKWHYEPPRLGGKPVIALETISFRVRQS